MTKIIRLEDGSYMVGGRKVPGVTSVLKVLWPQAQHYRLRTAQIAAERGREVHDVIANLLRGRKIARIDPKIEPFVEAWTRFSNETDFHAEVIEEPVYSSIYNYAGTLDAVGFMAKSRKPRLAVFDWKTSNAPHITVSMGPQLAAYEQAYHELKGGRRLGRFAILLGRDGQYRIEAMWNWTDISLFLSCLNVYNAINGGIR